MPKQYTLEQFAASHACKSRLHCEMCQDAGASGRAFRLHLGLPKEVFVCLQLSPPPSSSPEKAASPQRKKRRLKPGSFVKVILSGIGVKEIPGCGCSEMQQRMDELGWFGCWRNRDEISDWFVSKAKQYNVIADRNAVFAMMRVLRRRGT